MFTRKTALVLGAGASLAMGYPLGLKLRRDLLDLLQAHKLEFRIHSGLQARVAELEEFLDAFRNSQAYSIDAFLARRPEFSDVGKLAIAAILLSCESKERLHSTEHPDNWYQYFFNGLAKDTWDSVDFSNVAVVTFNYDRSLEEYIITALMASYGKKRAEAAEKLRGLEIVHVYGALGGAEPWTKDYLSYGEGYQAPRCHAAAKCIQVIPEGRNSSPTVLKARKILEEADAIAFLGFGFDALNLSRLDSKVTCAESVQRPGGHVIRRIAATVKGMTRREAIAAYLQFQPVVRAIASKSVPEDFLDAQCLEMLRETLILGDAY